MNCKCPESKEQDDEMVYVGSRHRQLAWYCHCCGRLAIQQKVSDPKSIEWYAPKNWFPGDDPE